MLTQDDIASIEEDLAKIIEMDQAGADEGNTELTPQQQAFVNDRGTLLRNCHVSADQLQDADRRYRQRQSDVDDQTTFLCIYS